MEVIDLGGRRAVEALAKALGLDLYLEAGHWQLTRRAGRKQQRLLATRETEELASFLAQYDALARFCRPLGENVEITAS